MPDPVTNATSSASAFPAASMNEAPAAVNERFAASLNGSLAGSLADVAPHATVSLGAMVGARAGGAQGAVGLGAMTASRAATGLAAMVSGLGSQAINGLGATASPAVGAVGAVGAAGALTANTPEGRQVAAATNFALAQLGKPYVFGTAGPDTFDCSGLVSAAYKQAGIDIPAYTFTQATHGRPIDPATEPLRAGDLIFVRGGRPPQDLGHVGMAISATEWIQAPHTGDVVKVGPLPYDRIQVVRRLVG